MPDSEVVGIAKSAWKYEREDRNWVGRSSRAILSREEILYFAHHKKGGDALLLWCFLIGQHATRKEAIVVDREAMAKANLLPGWTAWRYREAIKALRELQLLRLVEGGQRRDDLTFAPNRYLLASAMAESRQYATGTVVSPRQSRGSRAEP